MIALVAAASLVGAWVGATMAELIAEAFDLGPRARLISLILGGGSVGAAAAYHPFRG